MSDIISHNSVPFQVDSFSTHRNKYSDMLSAINQLIDVCY